MDLVTFDLALRLILIGQHSIIIAAVLWSARNRAGLTLALFCLSLLVEVIITNPSMQSSAGILRTPMLLLSGSVPWVFWFFVRETCEITLSSRWIFLSWALIVGPKYLIISGLVIASEETLTIFKYTRHLFAMGITVHIVAAMLRTYNDDLLHKRRIVRVALTVVAGIMILSTMISEMYFNFGPGSIEVNLMVSASITLATLIFGPLLITNTALISECTLAQQHSANPKDLAHLLLKQQLHQRMRDGAYKDSSLSIGKLAEQLAIPEHKLRKLINGDLGYRNFSAYVQEFRIAQVCDQLRDPAQSSIPVLSLALEAGFGSIGPFNRAFKSITGLTPSEYRSNPPRETEKS